MNKAKWIWYYGDYELYHHLKMSQKREEFEAFYPPVWHMSSPEKNVNFRKTFSADTDSEITVVTRSVGVVTIDYVRYPVNKPIKISKGQHDIQVGLCDIEAFPSCYIDSEYLKTDETWSSDACDKTPANVGCCPEYCSPDDDPRVFPFIYETVNPISEEKKESGYLYDFGKETFAKITIDKIEKDDRITLIYGESREEALDYPNAIIREKLTYGDSLIRPARAMRYLFVSSEKNIKVKFTAEYEYIPLEAKSSFDCENELIKKIWDLSVYTFHLNSREFFLDGIKRDRWVWAGDAYQSFWINRCLWCDDALTERTITALIGKPPYRMHINSINDYTAFLIISIWEHYFATGKIDFLRNIYQNTLALFNFILSRLDENGFEKKVEGDWVFIDHGTMDREGPICPEQILLWKVYDVMDKISSALGYPFEYSSARDNLSKKIREKYWDGEKGAFIDSFESGNRFVSRQTNIFAILYDFADEEERESIIKNVFDNPDLLPINTPYFKLYELLALAKIGRIEEAQSFIEAYWGGMIKEGATTIWEQYDPTKKGIEHYEMYGKKFGKSLAHAWGSGPVFILINNCAGVYPTSVGSKTFDVKPQPGKYGKFTAKVPVRDGSVSVDYINGKISVLSTVSGGTLIWKGQKTEIPVNTRIEK